MALLVIGILGVRVGTMYSDLKDILHQYGCYFVRQASGSHELWYSPVTARHFTVAVTIKSRHTANGILKQAGIGKKL